MSQPEIARPILVCVARPDVRLLVRLALGSTPCRFVHGRDAARVALDAGAREVIVHLDGDAASAVGEGASARELPVFTIGGAGATGRGSIDLPTSHGQFLESVRAWVARLDTRTRRLAIVA